MYYAPRIFVSFFCSSSLNKDIITISSSSDVLVLFANQRPAVKSTLPGRNTIQRAMHYDNDILTIESAVHAGLGEQHSPPRRNCHDPLRPVRINVRCPIANNGKNILSPCAAFQCVRTFTRMYGSYSISHQLPSEKQTAICAMHSLCTIVLPLFLCQQTPSIYQHIIFLY
jgi:hypothetical protein